MVNCNVTSKLLEYFQSDSEEESLAPVQTKSPTVQIKQPPAEQMQSDTEDDDDDETTGM